jgi:tetratricopeptide (TPR) repeat protein
MRWLLLAVTVFAGGCSGTFQYKQLDAGAFPQLPRRHELTDTPFHPQEIHHCGPSALAILLNRAGIDVTPHELTQQVYLPGRKGSLGPELLAAPRHYGRLAYKLQPELGHLLREVADGFPVLVLQNLGLAWIPRWHYAVVVGFDLDEQYIILRSGRHKRVLTDFSTFERTWRRSDYWAFTTLKPGQLPAVPYALPYLQAITGLERTGHWLSASKSYQAAVKQWPDNPIAWMGLGNSRYALEEVSAAEQAYRQALTLDAGYAPAHNNLAQTLADQERWQEAEIHARKAVKLGGAHQATYRQTLDHIILEKNLTQRHKDAEKQKL